MTRDYYGTKRITAWHQEKDDQVGYGVKYADGYQSWCPKEAFEEAYQPLDALSFGHALLAATKHNKRIARQGWNGKHHLEFVFYTQDVPSMVPMLVINTGSTCVPWVPSQTDQLANDWQVLDEEPTNA